MKRFIDKYLIIICFSFWTCEDKITVSSLDSIQIIISQDVLMPKQTTYIYARGFDKDGNRLDRLPVEWSTSNPEIASIDSEGKVVAISKGVARITAKSSTISASSDIIISVNKKRVLSEMFTSST
tara:strand:- start:257 stop:631 length:375 start_codon:yes stop_codon:yes gene_type:complete